MHPEHFFYSLAGILFEMAPYILLGFLFAGLLHEFVPSRLMGRHFSGNDWKSVGKAALFGIPLPLCSCGVLPTAVGLRRQGASRGATTSFLIATPQTGVDSIAATYSLLGLPFAIIRPVAALAGSFFGGMIVAKTDNDAAGGEVRDMPAQAEAEKRPFMEKMAGALRYGFVDMVGSVGKWLVTGLFIAALITVFMPESWILSLNRYPVLAMLAMVAIAVPMYICATGSIPIALSLMMKGMSPGVAFVLLMAGPAANFASVMVLGKAMGKRATAAYVGSVVVTAVVFGMVIDYLLPGSWFAVTPVTGAGSCHVEAPWFSIVCGAVLTVLLINAFVKERRHHKACCCEINNNQTKDKATDMTKKFKITGMNCGHCRAAAEKAIQGVEGVENATVDLASGMALVEGEATDEAVIAAVEAAGFNATPA